MGKYDVFYKAREVVRDILKKDLLGPVEEDETIYEIPTSYYLAGKLYPQDSASSIRDEADPDDIDNMTDDYDAMVSLSNQLAPSSMGLTFVLKGARPSLYIQVEFARYERADDDTTARAASEKGAEDSRMFAAYKRRSYRYEFEWDITQGRQRYVAGDHASVYVLPRPCDEDDAMVVTVSLANAHRGARYSHVRAAEMTLFQPFVKVSLQDDASRFSSVDRRRAGTVDVEVSELDLLYNDVACFAQGHGCAAVWEEGPEFPSWVSSSFIPSCQVLQMEPHSIPDMDIFKMKRLAEGVRDQVLEELRSFIGQYASWISNLETHIDDIPADLRDQARGNIRKCRETKGRLDEAVDILGEDELCWRAFRLANHAMLAQRCRSLSNDGRECDDNQISWYPFQLAFLLQEIPSFANPGCDERSIADLLWFPTGGGKTEAYLGVAAFCIFLRRLRSPQDGGTVVIMRYTLRLLTLQQFERASALICACEVIRRREQLGGEPITVGLWVGGELSPNKLLDAQKTLDKLKASGALGEGDVDPVQVKKCPWCGQVLNAHDYHVDAIATALHVNCSNPDCDFHMGEGLPVEFVDDVIYARPATFVVSTVDKFAQVPMEERAVKLFGIETSNNPPELIVQDELHLIAGPLGTIVGIYEMGIERLCEKGGIPPKVLASTATVRNAREQLASLYARSYAQFPPQGLTMKDSFFAVEASPDDKPGRLYVGVMGTASTQTTSLIHVQSALLFATRYLEVQGYSDEVVDAYWTLVNYFSTLRELGSALTTVNDRVQSRFAFLAKSKMASVYPGVDSSKRYGHALELTSRIGNSEITQSIAYLETPFTRARPDDAFDFALATNMISVGVDVGRLGAMVVNNQPKSNSEYIQATSRVGRRNPGLVVTVYNASRSRDRSHYEQFLKFHTALYRYVESSSLTPFSDRSRDRALHTVFIMLCRYLVDGLAPNQAASKFDSSSEQVSAVVDYILDYVKKVDPDELDNVKYELECIIGIWEERCGEANLVYKDRANGDRANQLLENDVSGGLFATMESMRNVEASSNIYLYRKGARR